MTEKVLAYITRVRNGRLELLTFTERAHPEAGRQVPAGTVERGEPIEAAVMREIEEESGLTSVKIIRKIAEAPFPAWGNRRHVFHLEAAGPVPDRWIHTVQGLGEDSGMAFDYSWAPLDPTLQLAGDQGRWLALLENRKP